jgi:4-hydroxy-4-methyl-2-oxoglutarate aldolase
MGESPHPEEGLSALEIAAALESFDTPTVANAIEVFGIGLRNEGYIRNTVRCMAPHLPPSVGYAFTLRVRSSSPPPLRKITYLDRTDWWEELECIPRPRILVIEDVDRQPGTGASIGGLHAEILRALGCVAVVTNGAVRDLPQAAAIRFQFFASHISVSHAYTHVVASGEPVKIDGLIIKCGDLLHGDLHGVIRVPAEIAARVPDVARELERQKREIIRFCRSDTFSLAGLRERLKGPTPKI